MKIKQVLDADKIKCYKERTQRKCSYYQTLDLAERMVLSLWPWSQNLTHFTDHLHGFNFASVNPFSLAVSLVELLSEL